jgi:hypothetical protein
MAISQTKINTTSIIQVYSSIDNTAVTAIYICNTSPATIHFSLMVVSLGDEPSPQQQAIYYSVPITSTDTYVIDTERLILANGDSIYIEVPDWSSNNIIATVSYIGI